MAGRVSTLYVRVVGDVSQYERNMVKASASTALFGREVKSQEKHMLQFSRGALLGSGALAGITRAVVFASSAFVGAYGLTYGIKTATDAAKEFQSQMELITTQAGASQREVTKMSKAILQVAPSLGQTPDALSKGLYHLESAGIRGGKALSALKIAAKGAAIGHAGLEDTVNALVGAFKSGISGAGNFGKTMAVLSSIVGAGNIRMADLESALGTGILSAGKAFGLGIKDVGAALATLSIGAVPVQEAATRLRMSFALLGGAGTIRANKALATIGLSTRKLANDLRSGGIIKGIGDLKDHLSALSKVDQTRLLTQAFGGGRFSTSIITLVQQFDLLKQRMGQIDHGVKMFGVAWERTQHTNEFATKKFQAALSVLQIEIGNALLPVLTRYFNSISAWFDKMNRTGQLQRDIKSTVSVLTEVFGEFGKVIQSIEPTIKTFIDLLGGLKNAVLLLGAAWIGMKTGLLPAMGQLGKSTLAAGASGVASMMKVSTATEATTADVYALSNASKVATTSLFGLRKGETAATQALYASPVGIPKGAKEGTVLYSQQPASAIPLRVPTPGQMYKGPGGTQPSGVPTPEQAAAANYGRPSGMESYRRAHGLPPVAPGGAYTPAGLRPTYVEQARPMIRGQAVVRGPFAQRPMVGPLEAVPVELRNVKEMIDKTVYDEASRAARGMAAYMSGRIAPPAGVYQGGAIPGGGVAGITDPKEAVAALNKAADAAETEAKAMAAGSIAQKSKLNDAQEIRGAANALEKNVENLRMVEKQWMGQSVLGANLRRQMFGSRGSISETPSGPYQVQIPGRRSLPIYDTVQEAYKKALETNGQVLDSQGRAIGRQIDSMLLMEKQASVATRAMRGMSSAFSKVGNAAGRLGSSISSALATRGQGIGLAAAIGGPMAASYLGLPRQVGSLVQGAGIGLVGSSMLGVNPLAGIAVGGGVAAGRAVGGEKGHLLAGGLIGAGLGAAASGAIAGSALGAAGGPLAPITVPVGLAVGALAGFTTAVLTLKNNTKSASDALLELAKAAPQIRKGLGQERRAVLVAKENVALVTVQRDTAKQGVAQARAQVAGTFPGTQARVLAMHNLRAAEAQLQASNLALTDSYNQVKSAQGQVTKGIQAQNRNYSNTLKVFEQISTESMLHTRWKNAKLVSIEGGGLQGYIDKMNKLGDTMEKTNPKFSKVARGLADIAEQTGRLPSEKMIKILLTHPGFAAAAARLTQILGHIPRVIDIKAQLFYEALGAKEAAKYGAGPHHTAAFPRALEEAKPKPPKPPKPTPDHEFKIPQKLALEQAKASTEGTKAQIKADQDLLAYTRKEIKSGKLTDKGLIDAYNEEAQLQNDLESLQKKRKKRASTAKLAEILPPRFTSNIQRAQAAVSTAQLSDIPTKQYAALSKLETAYTKALNFLKAEHETGAKRLLQIKEEAALTGKIADVRKQMKQLLADAIDTARQQIGGLFQGPLLAPTAAQQKAQLGMPGPDIGRLTADMKAQTAQYRRFTNDLTKLAKRGAPKELLKELRAMGPDALPYIESLLQGSKKALNEFFKTFAKREMLIQKVAKIEMNAANVVIHAAHLRQAGRVLARQPAGRRGSTTSGRPAPIPAAPRARHRADGGIISYRDGGVINIPKLASGGIVKSISNIANSTTNHFASYAKGGIAQPRTLSGAIRSFADGGGVVDPVPGGVYRVAEAGHPEMVIPLDPSRRERAFHLLNQTMAIVGKASGGIARSIERYAEGGLVKELASHYREGGIVSRSAGGLIEKTSSTSRLVEKSSSSFRDGGLVKSSSIRESLISSFRDGGIASSSTINSYREGGLTKMFSSRDSSSYRDGGLTKIISSHREGGLIRQMKLAAARGIVSLAWGGPIDGGSAKRPHKHPAAIGGLSSRATSQAEGGSSLGSAAAQLVQAINAFTNVVSSLPAKGVKSYADGGIERPVPGGVYRVAEAGHPEMIIPLDPAKRTRAQKLVSKTMNIIGRSEGGMESCYRSGGMVSFADGGIPTRRTQRKQYPGGPTDFEMRHQLDAPSKRFVNRRADLLFRATIARRDGKRAEAYRLFESARHMEMRRLGIEDRKGRTRPFVGPLTPELKFITGPMADFFVPTTANNRRMFAGLWHKFRDHPTPLNAGMLALSVAAFVPGIGGGIGRSAKATKIAWELLAGEKFVKAERKFYFEGLNPALMPKALKRDLEMQKIGTEGWARLKFYQNETRLNEWMRGNHWRELPREQRVVLRTLIKAMGAHRLKKDVVLFRGINHRLLQGMREHGALHAGVWPTAGSLPKVGEKLRDRGILTTSVSDQEARGFARDEGGEGVLLKIMAHKGQHYVAGNPFEREVLFPANSELKVLGVRKILTESYKHQQKMLNLFVRAQKEPFEYQPRLLKRLPGPAIPHLVHGKPTSFWPPGLYKVADKEVYLQDIPKEERHFAMITADLHQRVPKLGKGGIVAPVPGGVYRVAEAGHPEMVIPLDPSKRDRARGLLGQTMSIVGRAGGGIMRSIERYAKGGLIEKTSSMSSLVEKSTASFRDGGLVKSFREGGMTSYELGGMAKASCYEMGGKIGYETGGMVQPPSYGMGGLTEPQMLSYRDGGTIQPTLMGRTVSSSVIRDPGRDETPINLRIFLDGTDITRQVTVRQERKKMNSVAQVRGRHYGVVPT
jgi:SLT domain-containing protein